MKKQLILSALIFSLSFSRATFTIEEDTPLVVTHFDGQKLTFEPRSFGTVNINFNEDQKQNNDLADNPLFTVAKKQRFKCYTDLKNTLDASEKSKKHHTMLKHTLTLGGLGAIAASTYFIYSQGYSNVPLKKAACTFFTSGLGLLSKYIIDEQYRNTTNTYNREKQAAIEKIADECNKKSNKDSINKLITNVYIDQNQSKVDSEYPKIQDLIIKPTPEINLVDKAQNLTDEEKAQLIKNVKEQKKLSQDAQLLLDAIECRDAYQKHKEHQENKVLAHKNLPAHKSTITLKLFGLAGCIIWAPEICSNFAVPYFNNIKMPNLSTGFTMPHFKATPLCAYFKKLLFTKS